MQVCVLINFFYILCETYFLFLPAMITRDYMSFDMMSAVL